MTGRPSTRRSLVLAIASVGGAVALITLVILLTPSHPVPAAVVAVVVVAAVYPLAETAIENTRRYGPHRSHRPGHGHDMHDPRDQIDRYSGR
jgi:hypothetical protein